MKRWLVLAVAAIAIAGFSTMSFAAIGSSHHDMSTIVAGSDSCYACHGIKETSTVTYAGAGSVGNLCLLRCHKGTGSAGNIGTFAANMPEYGVYDNGANTLSPVTITSIPEDKYTLGHKMAKASIPVPDASTDVSALTTWPYTSMANMQCTTCHDVHSNEYAPFIRAPLSTGDPATSFCEQCHKASTNGAARWVNLATTAPNGSHPSEVDYSGAATRSTLSRLGRTIAFKDVLSNDNGVFRNVSHFSRANLNVSTNHYNPGGKLGVDYTVAQTPSSGGRVGCYTCHAVHQPMANITGQPQVSQMIVAPYKNVNASATMFESDLCIGCHGGVNDPATAPAASIADNNCVANPGQTSYYHPVDGDSRPVNVATPATSTWTVSTGTFNIVVNLDNGGSVPLINNRLACASCHTSNLVSGTSTTSSGVHAGPASTMLLNPKKATCESCHNTTAIVTGLQANSHHIYGGGATEGTRYTGTYTYPSTVPYNATVSANIADGLQCNDCHTFNGTAHNWN